MPDAPTVANNTRNGQRRRRFAAAHMRHAFCMPADSPAPHLHPHPHPRPVVKRTALAILLDADELLLIKRTKPDEPPYWITPGGGVEPEDATVVDALHREVDEELG